MRNATLDFGKKAGSATPFAAIGFAIAFDGVEATRARACESP